MGLRIRLLYREHCLRPGGTLSGPTLTGPADRAMCMVVLAMDGPDAGPAVKLARLAGSARH